jgi:hypothetical protein
MTESVSRIVQDEYVKATVAYITYMVAMPPSPA